MLDGAIYSRMNLDNSRINHQAGYGLEALINARIKSESSALLQCKRYCDRLVARLRRINICHCPGLSQLGSEHLFDLAGLDNRCEKVENGRSTIANELSYLV